MLLYIIGSLFLIVIAYVVIQIIRYLFAVDKSKQRLASYNFKTATFDFGNITYIDEGSGEVILSIHGIFGGYDQAFDSVSDFKEKFRIIAPSRFGYLGSDILNNGMPSDQATALVQLLDELGIDKVYVLGTSAGGTVAIRFALDYPERTKGVILYSSAMPYNNKPKKYQEYAGPPIFLCNDYMMYLISPFFKLIMSMDPSTIYSMLPISKRKDGVVLDASIINPDMARNFEKYPIESLQPPVLIFHSKDDKIANYQTVENVIERFPNKTLLTFETGGHLMIGHSDEIKEMVLNFVMKQYH